MKLLHVFALVVCAAGVALGQVSNAVSFNCPEPDGLFAHGSACNMYVRCTDGEAREEVCPDGLLFKEGRGYPCAYPQEVDCAGLRAADDPQPTEDCPRQFAIFRSSQQPNECGGFTNCVNGKAFYNSCPETLAFNARTLLCDYADEVDDCDASSFLNYQCAARDFSPAQVGEFTKEAHPSDCTKFYVCLNKEDGSVQPRLQGCQEPAVFDPALGQCSLEPENVPGCENAIAPEVLQAYRARAQKEADRRESRLQELRQTLQG